jgi:hypothetical protein
MSKKGKLTVVVSRNHFHVSPFICNVVQAPTLSNKLWIPPTRGGSAYRPNHVSLIFANVEVSLLECYSLLCSFFDSSNTFAKCYFEDNAGDILRCPFKTEDTVYLLSFAIIMLNTDLHKSGGQQKRKRMSKNEFLHNFRGADKGCDISREYLSAVYESVESNPIIMPTPEDEANGSANQRTKTLHDMLNNARSADTLLRGLAVHCFHFATIEDFVTGLDYNATDALGDLTRSCVAKTWHQWHGVIATGLETAHLDPIVRIDSHRLS